MGALGGVAQAARHFGARRATVFEEQADDPSIEGFQRRHAEDLHR
jgi:hypothetical protein